MHYVHRVHTEGGRAVIARLRPSGLAVGVLAVAVLTGLAACGGSSSKDAASSSSASSASAPASSSAAPAGSSADPATVAAVTSTFVTLFNGAAPLDQRLALLQNGDPLAQALSALATSPLLKQTSATVSKVTLTSPTQAQVIYTVLLSGTPVFKDQSGTAVQVNGSWKVAASTFCNLLTAAGQTQSICTQPSVTALPS